MPRICKYLRYFEFGLGILIFVQFTIQRLQAEDNSALKRIDRSVAKEPDYSGQPRYGLFVFGPKAQTRVWAVLDQSDPTKKHYNVLYFDRNANGNLTDPGERIEGRIVIESSDLVAIEFPVGQFNDSVSKQTHTEFKMSVYKGRLNVVYTEMKWNDKYKITIGHDETARGDWKCQFSLDAKTAPIFWSEPSAPLTFSRYVIGIPGDSTLQIGEERDINVCIGRPGMGRNSFSAVSVELLPPKLPIHATLQYTDTNGKEREILYKLRERC